MSRKRVTEEMLMEHTRSQELIRQLKEVKKKN